MKLLFILGAILALTRAEEIEDSEVAAAENVELLRTGVDLATSASNSYYVPPSNRPTQWQQPQNTWNPPPKQPVQEHNQGQSPNNVQNDYYWSTPNYHYTTTTTPVPVIKNEHYIGDHGDYRYEYQIGDGTHVGEQGWFTSPNHDESSLVKKGWYSYLGADGKQYTVTYWADQTGFHAFGDHLPTPPPVPHAIQAALDKQKEEEKYTTQNPLHQTGYPTTSTPTYNPTQPPYNPTQHPYVPPQPTYNPTTPPPYVPTHPTYPTQPPYVPTQPPYYPSKPAYDPTPSTESPTVQITYKPPQQYYPPQQTYNPPQQTYNPPQQTYNPPQQTYNPPQQPYNPPQQTYNPPQQTYYPQQYPQNNYVQQ